MSVVVVVVVQPGASPSPAMRQHTIEEAFNRIAEAALQAAHSPEALHAIPATEIQAGTNSSNLMSLGSRVEWCGLSFFLSTRQKAVWKILLEAYDEAQNLTGDGEDAAVSIEDIRERAGVNKPAQVRDLFPRDHVLLTRGVIAKTAKRGFWHLCRPQGEARCDL